MYKQTLEDRVRALIERSGSSQAQFALSVGLDASKLSKSLSGTRRFSSLDLARIAEVGRVKVDWLLNGDSDEALIAARVSHTQSSVSAAIHEAERLAEARNNLTYLGVDNATPKPPTSGSSLWTEQGKDLAAFALEYMGVPADASAESFAKAIEAAFGIDVRVLELEAGCDGLALCSEDARILLVATTGNPTRQRFTMAHELAHLLERDNQPLHIDENVMAHSGARNASETRANAFAAALLMPEAAMHERFGSGVTDQLFMSAVMDLMVSPSSLAWRLFNLKLLDAGERARLGRLRTVDAANAARRMQEYATWVEGSSQERLPIRLIRDALQTYVEGKSTLRPVADLFEAPIDALRAAIDAATGDGDAESGDDFAP